MSDIELRDEDGFRRFYLDGERVGFLTTTKLLDPACRFKWVACSLEGYSPTREKAVEAVESLVPMWRQMKAKEAAKDAAFAKLHPALQEAVNRENEALFEYDRARFSRSATADRRRDAHLRYLCAQEMRQAVESQLLEAEAA